MEFQPVRPDLISYQVRQTQGTPIWAKETKTPGGFGRFLSGMGRVLGAVSLPLSFVFPPAALAAAGMYGASQIGDIVQARSYTKAIEQSQVQQQASYVVYPGLDMGGAGPRMQPAAANQSYGARDEQVMNVLFARDGALHSMAEGM